MMAESIDSVHVSFDVFGTMDVCSLVPCAFITLMGCTTMVPCWINDAPSPPSCQLLNFIWAYDVCGLTRCLDMRTWTSALVVSQRQVKTTPNTTQSPPTVVRPKEHKAKFKMCREYRNGCERLSLQLGHDTIWRHPTTRYDTGPQKDNGQTHSQWLFFQICFSKVVVVLIIFYICKVGDQFVLWMSDHICIVAVHVRTQSCHCPTGRPSTLGQQS